MRAGCVGVALSAGTRLFGPSQQEMPVRASVKYLTPTDSLELRDLLDSIDLLLGQGLLHPWPMEASKYAEP